jgi:hypothetical protein
VPEVIDRIEFWPEACLCVAVRLAMEGFIMTRRTMRLAIVPITFALTVFSAGAHAAQILVFSDYFSGRIQASACYTKLNSFFEVVGPQECRSEALSAEGAGLSGIARELYVPTSTDGIGGGFEIGPGFTFGTTTNAPYYWNRAPQLVTCPDGGACRYDSGSARVEVDWTVAFLVAGQGVQFGVFEAGFGSGSWVLTDISTGMGVVNGSSLVSGNRYSLSVRANQSPTSFATRGRGFQFNFLGADTIRVVPEPATIGLFGTALLAALVAARSSRRRCVNRSTVGPRPAASPASTARSASLSASRASRSPGSPPGLRGEGHTQT